jgi:hypothetical protein
MRPPQPDIRPDPGNRSSAVIGRNGALGPARALIRGLRRWGPCAAILPRARRPAQRRGPPRRPLLPGRPMPRPPSCPRSDPAGTPLAASHPSRAGEGRGVPRRDPLPSPRGRREGLPDRRDPRRLVQPRQGGLRPPRGKAASPPEDVWRQKKVAARRGSKEGRGSGRQRRRRSADRTGPGDAVTGRVREPGAPV